MSTFVVFECRTKPDRVDDATNFLRKVLPDTRAYEGFIGLVVHQSQDDPTSLMMYEQWSTRTAYEAYLAWRNETGVLDEFVDMLAGPPSIRFFDLVDA
jgi:quinol monooxygenase YgiN